MVSEEVDSRPELNKLLPDEGKQFDESDLPADVIVNDVLIKDD